MRNAVTHTPLLRSAALAATIALLLLQPAAAAAPPDLRGAGAIFPFPLYATWLAQFARDPRIRDQYNSTGIRVDYQADNSATGIADLVAGRVDFAASDTPISDQEIKQVERGVVALPMTAGSIVLAYNLPGVDGLRLPRAVYPKIFAGKITEWNDPAIAAANPDATLPQLPITVVVRADATRATEVLTAHLSAIDAGFKAAVGASKSPQWPESETEPTPKSEPKQEPELVQASKQASKPARKTFVTATRNDGVAALIQQTPGAIGYMDAGYARLVHRQQVALIENKAGAYVAASPEAGTAALAGVRFPRKPLPSGAADLRAETTDPEADDAYPIVAMTYMLFYATGYEGERLTAVQDLIDYCVSDAAQGEAAGLGYVPLPAPIIERVEKAAEAIR